MDTTVNPSSEEIELLMSATILRYPERIADTSNKIQISVFNLKISVKEMQLMQLICDKSIALSTNLVMVMKLRSVIVLILIDKVNYGVC